MNSGLVSTPYSGIMSTGKPKVFGYGNVGVEYENVGMGMGIFT